MTPVVKGVVGYVEPSRFNRGDAQERLFPGAKVSTVATRVPAIESRVSSGKAGMGLTGLKLRALYSSGVRFRQTGLCLPRRSCPEKRPLQLRRAFLRSFTAQSCRRSVTSRLCTIGTQIASLPLVAWCRAPATWHSWEMESYQGHQHPRFGVSLGALPLRQSQPDRARS